MNFILRNGYLGQKLLRHNLEKYPVIPEPDEELEDSELSDYERREAIAREKTRRDGLT